MERGMDEGENEPLEDADEDKELRPMLLKRRTPPNTNKSNI